MSKSRADLQGWDHAWSRRAFLFQAGWWDVEQEADDCSCVVWDFAGF